VPGQPARSGLAPMPSCLRPGGGWCGQVLKDESTLADNNVSETGFMVVMVSKARARCTPPRSRSEAPPHLGQGIKRDPGTRAGEEARGCGAAGGASPAACAARCGTRGRAGGAGAGSGSGGACRAGGVRIATQKAALLEDSGVKRSSARQPRNKHFFAGASNHTARVLLPDVCSASL